jgi:trehalose 6-phosphate synthase/phosphatase
LTDNVIVRKLPANKNRAPTPAMLAALQRLCNDPLNQVWIISGRDEATLDNWLGTVQNLGLSAEHGSFIKNIGSQKWIHLLEHVDMSWKHDVVEIFTYYAERTQGSFIEHKRNSVTWHYNLANADYGAFQSKECQNHLEIILSRMPVEVLVGKKYLEVRPTATNKGEIMKRLLSTHTDVDFVMCCGDDKTDEDMFKVLNKLPQDLAAFSVVVGMEDTKKKTVASWGLPTVQDVLSTFTAMASSSSE